jgi:hypothetical protein
MRVKPTLRQHHTRHRLQKANTGLQIMASHLPNRMHPSITEAQKRSSKRSI